MFSTQGSDIDVYLLIEFQSDIDERKLKAVTGVPPVLLLVLYNGQRRWNAATSARELIALSPDSTLWPWQPRGRYHLCDMGAFPQDELARRSSLVALLFRLERRHSTQELKELVDEVIGWFQRHRGYERLRRLFSELIREAFTRHRIKLPRSRSLLDMRSMLTIDNTAWHAQLRAELHAKLRAELRSELRSELRTEFLAEGMAKGKAEGKSEALIYLLTKRFGAVAPSTQKRIRRAKLATLERWFKRAIAARDLRSVFNSPR